MSKGTEVVAQKVCGCEHPVESHDENRCLEWWRYPDVLNARACGCKGVWTPDPEDSRRDRWLALEHRASETLGGRV